MPSATPDSPSDPIRCQTCRAVSTPWTTTCVRCGVAVHPAAQGRPLSAELAAPLVVSPAWVDIAISAEEPAKVALLCRFLTANNMEFEQSRRFISVPAKFSEDLIERIYRWSFHNDLIDDERHSESLAETMREIGTAVMAAIVMDQPSDAMADRSSGIDLR